VVLLNLGGPDSLEAVEPFLYNLFSDPDIIDFPGSFLVRKPLARYISGRRAPKVQEQYKEIGGKSPLLDLTIRQGKALEEALNKTINCKVYLAMRYWHPYTEETLQQIEKDGADKIVLLPLYPQYSCATTGSSVNEWNKFLKDHPALKNIETIVIRNYFNFEPYINSIISRIKETLQRMREDEDNTTLLLFSAHGTPMKLVKNGDPYSIEIQKTVEEVVKQSGLSLPYKLSFQSKVGPQKWLEPNTRDVAAELAGAGIKNILVVPIAFVSDHLETLFELGIEYRRIALENGAEQFVVMEGLNDSPEFVDALRQLVLNALNVTSSD